MSGSLRQYSAMLHISFFRAVGALFAALPPQLLGTTAIQAGGAQLHAGTGRKGIAALGAVAGRETPQRHCAKVGQLHRNNSRNAAAAAGVLTDPASGALPGIHSHGEGTLSGEELQGIVGAGVGAIAAVVAAVIEPGEHHPEFLTGFRVFLSGIIHGIPEHSPVKQGVFPLALHFGEHGEGFVQRGISQKAEQLPPAYGFFRRRIGLLFVCQDGDCLPEPVLSQKGAEGFQIFLNDPVHCRREMTTPFCSAAYASCSQEMAARQCRLS